MCPGASGTLGRREQGCQPVPYHIDQYWRLHLGVLLGLRWCLPLPPAVVIKAGPGLMPPAPPRPVQDARRTLFYHRHELPEQPADFGTTQADRSPRCALK